MSFPGNRGSEHCTIEESTIQPLLPPITSGAPPTSTKVAFHQSQLTLQAFSKPKGIVMILLWNVIVGIIYGILQCVAMLVAIGTNSHSDRPAAYPFRQAVFICMGILALISFLQIIFYPLSGLLADMKCGRYRIVTLSQVVITLALLLLIVAGVLSKINSDHYYKKIIVICAISTVLVLPGFTGFQSNAVQFGLDQLLDAPSKTLSSFLCWYVWTDNIGQSIARITGSLGLCYPNINKYLYVFPIILSGVTSSLLLLGCYKHSWFYCETKTYNPYQKIYKVLKFVAKNKYPLRRSAMTYCDDIVPSRMDYAKLLYGGPFTTEVVEDVKTFLRMLLMLFLVSPVFYYTVPGAYVFPLYGLHMGKDQPANKNPHCNTEWVILQSGNLAYIVTFIGFPVYIFLFQRFLRKWLVLILQRLILGIVLMVAFMWVMTLLYAAAIKWAEHRNLNTSCLFTSEYRDNANYTQSYTLDFPVYYLILPNILAGIGLPIINVAILEFISAQSPHTMKGLLLGVFYHCRGIYSLIGNIAVFPFTFQISNWSQHSPFLECGFLFYIYNSLLGVVFIVVAIAAFKRYRYRQREDKPYDHRYVEEYYGKYARQRDDDSYDEEDSTEHQVYFQSIDDGTNK